MANPPPVSPNPQSPVTITISSGDGSGNTATVDGTGALKTSGGGGGGGGTSSNFGATFPTAGTAIGAKNGANMVNLVADASGNLQVGVATALPAGTNSIGTVVLGAGTAAIGSLTAGTAIIGKVGIDQTTPGTTNGVQDAADGPVIPGTAAGKSGLAGGVFNSTPPAPTTGQQLALQQDAQGNLRVQTGPPLAANVLTANLNGAGTLLTIPAGRTWIGSIVISAGVVNPPANAQAGGTITVSTAGTGVVPAAGVVAAISQVVSQTQTGANGTEANTCGTFPGVVVIAPIGNSVTLVVANSGNVAASYVSAIGLLQ